jgi:capsular exopolysaccharide synthesis family protein
MALALFLSSVLAIIAVVVSDRIDTTIRNPDQITLGLKARVIGILPILKKSHLLAGIGSAEMPTGDPAAGSHSSPFEESIRTIRNSILLTDFDRRLRSVLMTSATPAEGKSTVVAHLAIAHAEQHHRTLLIDGDMRRPSLHKLFHIPNTGGLSKVVEHKVPWRDLLIQPRPDLELYILPAGPSTRRAADLVGQVLPHLLEDAAEDFHLTLLDAPPILGFPEPLQMAVAADGVVIVTLAGQTDRTAVAAVLDTLSQLRANVVGLVLNQVRKETTSSYRYYAGNYGNYYSKRGEDQG